jgi:hypothetical protein
MLIRTLRVCPKTSCRIAKLSQHEPDGGEAQAGERFAIVENSAVFDSRRPAQPAQPIRLSAPMPRAGRERKIGVTSKQLAVIRGMSV